MRETTEILARCKGEFLEMPGMHVTIGQAIRLWRLDAATCEWALESLVRARFLKKAGSTYCRITTA